MYGEGQGLRGYDSQPPEENSGIRPNRSGSSDMGVSSQSGFAVDTSRVSSRSVSHEPNVGLENKIDTLGRRNNASMPTTQSPPSAVASKNSEQNAATISTAVDPVHDPRRKRPKSTLLIAESEPDVPSNFLKEYLSAMVSEAVLKSRLGQGQERLKLIMEEEEELRKTYPDFKEIRDQKNIRIAKYSAELNQLSNMVEAAEQSQGDILEAAPQRMKDLFQGLVYSKASKATNEIDTNKKQLEDMRQRIENLERRDAAREADYQRLQTLLEPDNAKIPNLELISHQLSDRLSTVDNIFERLAQHQQLLDEHSKFLEAQRESLNDNVLVTAQLRTVQHQPLESLATNEAEEDFSYLKATIKDHKQKFANLSNQFVSKKDLEIQNGETAKLKKPQTQSLDRSKHDIKEIKEKLDSNYKALTSDMEKLKKITQNLKERGAAQSNRDTMQDLAEVKDSIQKLEKRVEQQLSVSAVPSADIKSEDFADLKKSVNMLLSVRGHYEKFYNDTESSFSSHREQLVSHEHALSHLTEQQNSFKADYTEELKSMKARLEANEKKFPEISTNINDLRNRGFMTSEQLHGELATHSKETEKKFNDLSSHIQRNIQPAMRSYVDTALPAATALLRGQVDNLKQELNILKLTVTKIDHSIQSLSTRYNAISTLHLHKAIIAAMNPQSAVLERIEDRQNNINERLGLLEHTNQRSTSDGLQAEVIELQEGFGNVAHLSQQMARVLLLLQINELQFRTDELDASIEENASNANQLWEVCESSRRDCDELRETLGNTQSLTTDSLAKFLGTLTTIQSRVASHTRTLQKQEGYREILTKIKALLQETASFKVRLDAVEVVRPDQLSERVTKLEDAASAGNLDHMPVIKQESHPLIDPTIDLSNMQDTLQNLALHQFYPNDRFITIKQLASTVGESEIRRKFQNASVRKVWFRGQKNRDNKSTTRYALVQINGEAITTIIADHNKQRWKGRAVEIAEADIQTIEHVLLNKSEPAEPFTDRIHQDYNGPSTRGSIDSAQPDVIGEEDLDTIVVDCTPTSSLVQDENNYLRGWIPHDASSNTPAKKGVPVTAASRTSTPASTGGRSSRGTKRSAEELQRNSSLSRPSGKRIR